MLKIVQTLFSELALKCGTVCNSNQQECR